MNESISIDISNMYVTIILKSNFEWRINLKWMTFEKWLLPFFQPVLQMLNCPIVSVMCMWICRIKLNYVAGDLVVFVPFSGFSATFLLFLLLHVILSVVFNHCYLSCNSILVQYGSRSYTICTDKNVIKFVTFKYWINRIPIWKAHSTFPYPMRCIVPELKVISAHIDFMSKAFFFIQF